MTYNKITISGRICTGKTTIFWMLQKCLGWSTFSASQFFRDYARTHAVSLERAEEQDRDVTHDVDTSMEKLLKTQQHIICEGWMAGIMADKLPDVLRLLLMCDDSVRIKRFVRRERISGSEAEQKIREREGSWTQKLEVMYTRHDFFDPKNYNCVIDTTDKTPKQTLDLVLQALGYFSANGQKAHT